MVGFNFKTQQIAVTEKTNNAQSCICSNNDPIECMQCCYDQINCEGTVEPPTPFVPGTNPANENDGIWVGIIICISIASAACVCTIIFMCAYVKWSRTQDEMNNFSTSSVDQEYYSLEQQVNFETGRGSLKEDRPVID